MTHCSESQLRHVTHRRIYEPRPRTSSRLTLRLWYHFVSKSWQNRVRRISCSKTSRFSRGNSARGIDRLFPRTSLEAARRRQKRLKSSSTDLREDLSTYTFFVFPFLLDWKIHAISTFPESEIHWGPSLLKVDTIFADRLHLWSLRSAWTRLWICKRETTRPGWLAVSEQAVYRRKNK